MDGTMKAPIAILSFNRPRYLEQTLSSLLTQTGNQLVDREIHLFQDGRSSNHSETSLADEALIEESIEIFKALFPNGIIHKQEKNLGIGLHFDFVERFFFEEKTCEVAIFFEDDMILGSNYLEVLELMIGQALENEKIGYVAAYGDHRASLGDQKRNPGKIVPMDHKWGFALTRRQWLRQRPIVSEYLKLIEGVDYRKRDSKSILKWMKGKGYAVAGSSQDGAKDLAMYLSGSAKFMTYACFGKYIGEEGVHYRKETYAERGFAKTELFPDVPNSFVWPSDAEIDQHIEQVKLVYLKNAANIEDIFEQESREGEESQKSPIDIAFEVMTGRKAPDKIRSKLIDEKNTFKIRTAILSDPELYALVPEFRLAHEISAIRDARRQDQIKLIIGAGGTSQPGWVSTNRELLDLLQPETWSAWLDVASVGAMLAEHVWEHLDADEGKRAAETCFKFLAPGGRLRIAVPDALFPDEDYRNHCKVGNRDGHKVFYDYRMIAGMLKSVGFDFELLEYWDESGVFHRNEWSERDGYIARSAKNDWRNKSGELKYTSLIVDAVRK